jgi:endonuclease/exonuclease/phosphatase family metal-dependent hydrolase
MDVYMKFSLLLILLLSFPGWAKWSVTTYNIRNFDKDFAAGRTDLVELAKILNDVKSDVMAFEEIVNKKAFDEMVASNLKGYKYEMSTCGGGGKQHLAVAYNSKTFDFVKLVEDASLAGNAHARGCSSLRPLLLVTLKHKETSKDYTFGVVHLKAGGNEGAFKQRWEQYNKLQEFSKTYENKNLILLGDFNTTGYSIKDNDFAKFEEFISTSELRTLSEAVACTSYWEGTLGGKEYQPSILDHIVVQDKNMNQVESVRVASHCAAMDCRPATVEDLGKSYQSVSDHCPLQVTFK